MKIAHFSDLHAHFSRLEYGLEDVDLVICTGDMLPNYPLMEVTWEDGGSRAYHDYHDMYADLDREKDRRVVEFGRRIDPVYEKRRQQAWISEHQIGVSCPVVVVRGNHDFTDLSPLFKAPEVFEVQYPIDAHITYIYKGLRIGGFRGIPEIAGEWSDERPESELESLCDKLPELDIVLTHCPPRGILDFGGHSHGSEALTKYLRKARPLLSCFGHIHECGGTVVTTDSGKCSNAATSLNILEI